MTVTALAEASGLTKGFISQVESGSSGVSLASLDRIAAALEVTPGSLIPSDTCDPAPLDADDASEPALIAARYLYQETSGLTQIADAQAGAHFLATLPPYSLLSGPRNRGENKDKKSEGIIMLLQGSLMLRSAAGELRVSAGEVASWDPLRQFNIENHAASTARALIFIPEGVALPALLRLPNMSPASNRLPYSSATQGPMRLVEMRARRQAERRR